MSKQISIDFDAGFSQHDHNKRKWSVSLAIFYDLKQTTNRWAHQMRSEMILRHKSAAFDLQFPINKSLLIFEGEELKREMSMKLSKWWNKLKEIFIIEADFWNVWPLESKHLLKIKSIDFARSTIYQMGKLKVQSIEIKMFHISSYILHFIFASNTKELQNWKIFWKKMHFGF